MIITAVPKVKKITSEEFYNVLPDSDHEIFELIEGEIISQASPSIAHQRLSMALSNKIYNFISSKKGKCEVFSTPKDVKLDEETIVVPDIFAACDPEKFDKQKYNGAPDWIIEIVSSDRNYDMFRKLEIYRKAGVREYWIIDPKYSRTIVYYFEDISSKYIYIYPFDTPVPANIYGGELMIDISDIL